MPTNGPMIQACIQQEIVDSIVAALQDVNPENHYQSRLTPTRLKPGIGEQASDGLVIVYVDQQRLNSASSDGPQETQADTLWQLDIGLEIIAVAQDDTEPVDQRAWIMWADVYKRLCSVGGIKHAQYVWPSQAQFEPDPSATLGFLECVFTIQYQHAANDPYST
jgi:hypothetical protein